MNGDERCDWDSEQVSVALRYATTEWVKAIEADGAGHRSVADRWYGNAVYWADAAWEIAAEERQT